MLNNVRYVHPVNDAGIRTHNLLNMSHLPDQGSRPQSAVKVISQHFFLETISSNLNLKPKLRSTIATLI